MPAPEMTGVVKANVHLAARPYGEENTGTSAPVLGPSNVGVRIAARYF